MSSNSHTSKPLWVTTHKTIGPNSHVFWPVIRGLMSASPEYTREIGRNPPPPFDDYFNWLVDRFDRRGDVRPFLDDDNPEEPHHTSHPCVRNTVQSNELYETIRSLECGLRERCTWIRIVIISRPELLRRVSDADPEIMNHVCTMYVPDTGPIIYSGKSSSPPLLNENLFLLLLDGIHRSGGSEAERIQSSLADLKILSGRERSDDDDGTSNSAGSIFFQLFEAIQVISRSQINSSLGEDNTKIAETLQRLFELDSYKKDVPSLPKDHARAVMNLTNHMLEYGVPDNADLRDPKGFILRARRFLTWLAAYLEELPNDLVVNGVVLQSEHAVIHGGFSNVYRGRFTDTNEIQVEIALKVLKIFEDQSHETRRLLNQKFMKEALIWHSLKR
ncbi:hypothetical protein B0H13DRAFT_2074350 [Mycena leptocephala]|nr:hypothetical protein B0H13DRAFT_2074350 [Mycena leptocephala]